MKKTVFNGAVKIGDYNTPKNPNGGRYFYQWSSTVGAREEGIFFLNDLLQVLGQPDCTAIALVDRNMNKTEGPSGPGELKTSRFACGVNSRGQLMNGNDNLLAAPCPPYCTGGVTLS